ncbi:hypothetical protein J3454_14425 [Erythrobacter sp. NFXS35]|uniref:hypothetical protein n=1 Tax=Erythrobacter sp. NFXS35 TaxID=2818436 RepID=UPI0032DED548
MLTVLVQIDAQDASGGALPVRLASHDLPELCHLGGDQWDPAIAQLPDFALDFFGGAFAGQVTAPRTGFSVMTTGVTGFAATASARARFADARVRIWVGDITSAASADLGPLTLRFDGRLIGEPEVDDAARLARFEAAVQDSWADDPLLPLFAGTGAIEGPADLTGQPKPLALGNVRFARGVLIDGVDNVWMVSNGAVQGISAAYDRLVSLGPSSGNHASLAALLAASIPNGSWATCLAQGLVRTGAPPDGRVSFDVQGSNAGTGGYARLPGAMIRRIADLAGGTVDAASLTALDSARPYNLQLQLSEQTTAREVIARIADSVAAVAGVSLTGELFAQPLGIGSAGETLNADGTSALRVLGVEELAKAAPSWKLATEAELTFEVHSADEAAFSYRWQGEYSATRVYRIDDVVTGPDGASWAFINATPAAGQALPVWPTTSNAHWRIFSVPGGAGVTVDEDGNIQGIGDGAGTPVSNIGVVLTGTLAARPASGAFIGQTYLVTSGASLGLLSRWSGSAWVDGPTRNTGAANADGLEAIDAGGPLFVGTVPVAKADSALQNTNVVLTGLFSARPATGAFIGQTYLVTSGANLGLLSRWSGSAWVDGPTRNTGALNVDGLNAVDAGGPLFVGTVPVAKADSALQNTNVVLTGLFSARPATGAFIGQTYLVTSGASLGLLSRWSGSAWVDGPTRNTGALNADGLNAVDAGGPLFVGQLPGVRINQDTAGNTIADPIEGAGWSYGGGAAYSLSTGTTNLYNRHRMTFAAGGSDVWFGSGALPELRRFAVKPGEVFFFSFWVFRQVGETGTALARLDLYGADGVYQSTVGVPDAVTTGGPTGSWYQITAPWTAPEGVGFARPRLTGSSVSAASRIFAALPYFGRHQPGADVTGTAQRSIEPQFPVIEIKQGEAGNSGNRTVTHVAKRGTEVLTGGTWSKPSQNLTGATVTINSSTGTATISGVGISGSYTPRYVHTDGITTEHTVNVTYVAAVPAITSASSIVRSPGSSTTFVSASNEMLIQIPTGQTSASLLGSNIELLVAGGPAGATNVEARWTQETSPGVWSIVGTAQAASPHPSVTDEGGGFFAPNLGSLTINRTATGLTAGLSYKFRLEMRVSGGNIKTVNTNGTVTAGA